LLQQGKFIQIIAGHTKEINMKYIKTYFILGIYMIVIACQKESTIHKIYHITVEDYFSNQPLEGRIVIMKYCNSASFVSGRAPCDSIEYAITDTRGSVAFSATYERGFGRGHEFVVIGGEGYPTTTDFRFYNNNEKLVKQLKPIVLTETLITSTLDIDSLYIGIDAGGYLPFTPLHFRFAKEDSIKTSLTTIPDQHNNISVMAYRNDTLIKWDRLSFTPVFQGPNKFKHVIY
jgi:hypothetical protein